MLRTLLFHSKESFVLEMILELSSIPSFRSVMAAAGSFRSTKALLLMVVLSSLVCAGKGLVDDDDLVKLKLL